MIHNPIQFAVVREDPQAEALLVERFGCQAALLIASGGCTALTLRSRYPHLSTTLVDMNPAQLQLVRDKLAACGHRANAGQPTPRAGGWKPRFNVATDDPSGLNACGNFESLFSGLRRFINAFVAERKTVLRAFDTDDFDFTDWFGNRYWPVGFSLFFSANLLNTMFGPAATQHAPKDSYPGYFRALFERGLQRPDRRDNYFLHHLLLGHYRDQPDALPHYLAHPPQAHPFEYVCGTLDAVPQLQRFDLLSISNIMDWLGVQEQRGVAQALDSARSGALLLTRQLNNPRDLGAVLGRRWQALPELSAELLASDRSLFYNRICAYRKA